jgi:hypothetical protein
MQSPDLRLRMAARHDCLQVSVNVWILLSAPLAPAYTSLKEDDPLAS